MKPVIFALLLTLSAISAYSQNSDWTYVNPNPQNNFYAIKFFNQNTGYVIGSGGVILKNTTGSGNWTALNSYTVRDLYAMHFFNVNTGYIVGDGGTIMYTSDGCASWTTIATGDGYALRSVTFVNQNTGFVVGDHGELYKTTSGITGWIPSVFTTVNLRSVNFPDSLNGYVCGDSGRVFRTTNGGINWSQQILGDASLTCVYFKNSLTGFITGTTSYSANNFYRTTDAGNNWIQVGFFRIQNNWNAVSFINQNTGFISGRGGIIMRTSDGGFNWSEGSVPVSTIKTAISTVDTLAFICGSNGWIEKISASGYSACLGGSRENLSSISFFGGNIGIAIGGHEIFTTSNGGANWNLKMYGWVSWEEGNDNYPVWARYYSSGNLYMVTHVFTPGWYPNEFLSKSTDGGVTWGGGYAPYIGYINGFDESEGVAFVSVLTSPIMILRNMGIKWDTVLTSSTTGFGQVSFANQNTGLVLGYEGNMDWNPVVYKTTDKGNSWSANPAGANRSMNDILLLPSGKGFMCGDSSYLSTTNDFGNSWNQISDGGNRTYLDIKFVNDYTGWIRSYVPGGPGNYTLLYTGNGGVSFVPLMSLGNFNVKDFTFINAYTGYVCGDSGIVLKTTNGGLTFVNPQISIVPESFSLSQNYPNPFNPSTKISFSIPLSRGVPGLDAPMVRGGRGVSVRLLVYDVLGREIATLVNEQLQPGEYSVTWDASAYPSGVYFYKLESGDFSRTKKMVLIK